MPSVLLSGYLGVKWAECAFVRDVNTSPSGNLSKIAIVIIIISNSIDIILIIIK